MDAVDAKIVKMTVAVGQMRKQFDCPRLGLLRWKEAIASLSVWHHLSRVHWSVVTQVGCGRRYDYLTKYLRVVLAAAGHGHGCRAVVAPVDSDRSG